MNKTDKLTPHQRIVMLSAIAERDKTISELKQEVKHYKRQYEIAVKRKLHERHERTERRKDRIALAVLLAVIAFVFLPMTVGAFQQTILWASIPNNDDSVHRHHDRLRSVLHSGYNAGLSRPRPTEAREPRRDRAPESRGQSLPRAAAGEKMSLFVLAHGQARKKSIIETQGRKINTGGIENDS